MLRLGDPKSCSQCLGEERSISSPGRAGKSTMNFEKLAKLTFWRAVLVLILSAGFYASLIRFTKGLQGSCDESDGPFPVGTMDWV